MSATAPVAVPPQNPSTTVERELYRIVVRVHRDASGARSVSVDSHKVTS
jgi:hypothetical protein